MPDPRTHSVLALAAELERRDEAAAVEIERVGELARRADAVRVRAAELHDLLEGIPAALAALDRDGAEARGRRSAAEATLADAETQAADVDRRRRAREDERSTALLELARAREAALDARAYEERVARRRASVHEEEQAGRAEAERLADEARQVAGQVAGIASVSQSGRDAPGGGLRALFAWGGRVGAALLVVRSQLEGERDRIVREANELGATMLDEQLAGSSVALVRRRLEEALRS